MDTLYIDLHQANIAESRDQDEDTSIHLDAEGWVCAITFEHASDRTDVSHLSVKGIAA